MWRHQCFSVRSTRILRHHLFNITRAKHDQSSSALIHSSYAHEPGNSEANVRLFLSSTSFNSSSSSSSPREHQELKSFDKFGLLSSGCVTSSPFEVIPERTFMDQLLSRDAPSRMHFSVSVIPTTADPSELGGSSESADPEQLEDLLDEGYEAPTALSDVTASEIQSDKIFCASPVSSALNNNTRPEKDSDRHNETKRMISEGRKRDSTAEVLKSTTTSTPACISISECPSSSKSEIPLRFDPDINRQAKASSEEVISAVYNQDLSSLRSILMEKNWPDQRSIGRHLDSLFELVIRDCYDVDEAMVFLQDFAASYRRNFLHDVNGVRLACRVAYDTRSVDAAKETLRVFRNMFLVKSPKFSTPTTVLENFYSSLLSIGSVDQVEMLHKVMIDGGFDTSSDIFIHVLSKSMLLKRDFPHAFGEWRRFSFKYGTTCASDLIWEGLLASVSDRKKQACFSDDLLSHCLQFDHPFAIVANLIVTLVRMKQTDAARMVFTKVSVPGRFFKKPLRNQFHHECVIQVIEDFASLIVDCMLADKRRTKKDIAAPASGPTFLSSDLLLVLDSFCSTGRQKKLRLSNKNEKRKLHRINDEQLFELVEFVQSLWLKKAESDGDTQAINRLVAWSMTNRLEIPPKLSNRIAQLKS
ncbi:hypothetical protein RB195_012566 [Necator americanus]|uniref:Pentatricopeptide repeat domain protein n=1 Tax=Necator americanus TaxID=51031 RepID=A0ABR1DS70_NECAM